ncbi:MAG: hypothetical protein EA398_10450 [Deltaproteobacteria bacterium]|nr:MAG: hypothetical protein EA398_10450 [Deltaproteobacteria bacterium]
MRVLCRYLLRKLKMIRVLSSMEECMAFEMTTALAGSLSGPTSGSAAWSVDEGGSLAPVSSEQAAFDVSMEPSGFEARESALTSSSVNALQAWLEQEQQLESAFAAVLDGQAASPRDLIHLQTLVAGASLRIETATRLVDRAVQALRQLTQMQV